MEKQIYRLDASAIKSASGCLRKLYWMVVTGYSNRIIINDIAYGSAVHIFKDTLKRTRGDTFKACSDGYKYFNKASQSPDFIVRKGKEFLTLAHLAETFQNYIEHFGAKHEKDDFQSLEDSSNSAIIVERKFSIPILEEDTYIIMLCGTIDDIGKFQRSGIYAIADEKFTTYWDKQKFFKPYALSTQLITYAWALRWHIQNIKDSPLFKELENKTVWTCINRIYGSKDLPAVFERSELIPMQDSLLDEYEIKLRSLATRLSTYINSIPDGDIPIREGIINDACFGKFNEPCAFVPACTAPDLESGLALNDRMFDKLPYNPLQHRDLTTPEIKS